MTSRMRQLDPHKDYLAEMYSEFGCVFGSNWQYTYPLPMRVIKPLSKLTDAERKEILKLRLSHIPYKQIEAKFNVTAQTIWSIQSQAGYRWPNNIG